MNISRKQHPELVFQVDGDIARIPQAHIATKVSLWNDWQEDNREVGFYELPETQAKLDNRSAEIKAIINANHQAKTGI